MTPPEIECDKAPNRAISWLWMPLKSFVGRSAQRERLDAHLHDCLAGNTQAICVLGPPGIGKSTLSDWFCDRARAAGLVVGWAKTWELGGAPPFWPWVQILRGLVAELGEDFDADDLEPFRAELGTLVPEWGCAEARMPTLEHAHAQFALFDALTRFVAQLATRRPLVLVFDDVHAGDPATLQLAAFALANWRRVPITVLATARSVDANTPEASVVPLASFQRACTMLPLGPLSPDSVGELFAQRAGRAAGADELQDLCARSGGNPLFVEGLATARGGGSRGEGGLPATVQTVIDQRLEALASGTVECLEALATIRHGATLPWLARMFELSVIALRARIQPACDAEIIRIGDDGGVAFVHDLFTEAIVRRSSAESRTRFAGRAARAWEHTGAESRRVFSATAARLFFESEAPEDQVRGVAHGLEAARLAREALDYGAAAGLFAAAVEHMPPGPERRQARMACARMRLRSGDPDAARVVFEQVIEAAEAAEDLEELAAATVGYAQTFEYGSYAPERVSRIEKTLARLPDDATASVAPLLSELAFALQIGGRGDQERREALIASAKRVRAASTSPVNRLDADVASFVADWRPATLEARTELVRDMESLVPSLEQEAQRLEVHRWRVNLWLERGAGREAQLAIRDYADSAEALRAPQLRMNAALRRSIPLQLAGDFDGLAPVLEELEAEGARAGDVQTATYVALGRCLAHFERRDEEGAARDMPAVAMTEKWWRRIAGPGQFADRSRLWQGDPETRRKYEERKRAGFPLLDYWSYPQGLAILVEMSLHFEDEASYATLYDRLAPFADHAAVCGIGWPLGCSALYLGRLAKALGRPRDALAHFRHAVNGNERFGAAYWVAQSRLALIAAQLENGGVDEESRAQLAAVVDEATAKGWTRTFEEARCLEARVGRDAVPGRDEIEAPAIDVRAHAGERQSSTRRAVFRRAGEVWEVGLESKTKTLKDARGHRYLHALLRSPRVEVHVLELAYPEGAPTDSDAGPVLDAAAKDAYRRRALSLRETQREAEANNDFARAQRAAAELDALAEELAKAVGLGGRDRKVGSAAERARSSVTQALRRAIKAIEKHCPELAAHLRNSVRSGVFCAYEPEPGAEIDWQLGDG